MTPGLGLAGKANLREWERVARTKGCVVMPGLVNSHDHLEFNLFPRLGTGHYPNATAWAREIYTPERSPVAEHLRVPKPVRLWWGGLKNLLSGVTTVCHHNPYEREVFTADYPVKVVRRFAWAHSLAFEPRLATIFRQAAPTLPFVVHCGEGTDSIARREFAQLSALGALDHRTVLVHAVALGGRARELVHRCGASLVWCPTSNLGMLGRTLSDGTLGSGIPIALATDSALSAPVDLLDEIALAQEYVTPSQVYRMVTSIPREILHLPPSARLDDWIAVQSSHSRAPEALLDGKIALVVSRGRVRLVAPDLADSLTPEARRQLQPLHVEGRGPVLVAADVRALRAAAEEHLGCDLRLAGKRILR